MLGIMIGLDELPHNWFESRAKNTLCLFLLMMQQVKFCGLNSPKENQFIACFLR